MATKGQRTGNKARARSAGIVTMAAVPSEKEPARNLTADDMQVPAQRVFIKSLNGHVYIRPSAMPVLEFLERSPDGTNKAELAVLVSKITEDAAGNQLFATPDQLRKCSLPVFLELLRVASEVVNGVDLGATASEDGEAQEKNE